MVDADDNRLRHFQNCLRSLELVNVCALSCRPTRNWLRKALEGGNSRRSISIRDVLAHHLTDSAVVKFPQWLDRHATRGWFINDLYRPPFPFYFVRYAMHFLGADPMITNDGQISVEHGFTASDWRRLIAQAGIPVERVQINRFFPSAIALLGEKHEEKGTPGRSVNC